MTLTVSRGIEDALRPPEPPAQPVAPAPRTCGASEWVGASSAKGGKRVWCGKPWNHDDPLSEIGSVRTDPTHEAIQHVGPVRVSYTWRSTRA